VLHKAQALGVYPCPDGGADTTLVAEIAAAFQDAVVDVITTKAISAVERYGAKGLVLGGGVSANGPLREACRRAPVPVIIPAPKLCTDNGSMIGAAGYYRLTRGVTHGMRLDATPSLALV
jgi:N6-L-threonylcarbamoyladenine synthase